MTTSPGQPRRSGTPVHHAPPRPRATAADQLFALAVAGLGLAAAVALFAVGGGAAWVGGLAAGAGADAPPPIPATAAPGLPGGVTPVPTATPTPAATSAPTPAATVAPTPAASPERSPGPFAMNLYQKGVFVHQADKVWCVAAAAQNMLNVIRLGEEGRAPDTSAATQRALYDRIVELTTWEDSHNGGTGPGGWAAILTEMGYPYEVRTYESRPAALRAAAAALRATGRPVGVLAWAGVHSWVMTGFTSTADPSVTERFTVTGANVLDPWYPWISTRWPRSEAPAVPRNEKDLRENILPWNLASGPYPGRDGMYLLVVPLGD